MNFLNTSRNTSKTAKINNTILTGVRNADSSVGHLKNFKYLPKIYAPDVLQVPSHMCRKPSLHFPDTKEGTKV
jgi:hypothetical protein